MPRKGHKVSEETRLKMIAARATHKPHIVGRYGLTEETVRAELAAGRIWCSDCKSFRDSSFFGNDKRKTRCKDCSHKRNIGKYAKDSVGERERRKAYYWANVDAERKRRKDEAFAKYGATREWYDSKLAEQGGGCAICGATIPDARSKFMFVDHRHECCNPRQACNKCRRGLLCGRCNSSLERIETDPQWGIKALAYLGRYA